MSAASAIVTALDAATAVTNLCGSRIYSVSAPDGVAAPFVVFQQISSDPGQSHREATGGTFRLFQFACFAATPKAARALRDAVIATLDGVTLSNGDNPTLSDERDGDVSDDAKLFRADADFLV